MSHGNGKNTTYFTHQSIRASLTRKLSLRVSRPSLSHALLGSDLHWVTQYRLAPYADSLQIFRLATLSVIAFVIFVNIIVYFVLFVNTYFVIIGRRLLTFTSRRDIIVKKVGGICLEY